MISEIYDEHPYGNEGHHPPANPLLSRVSNDLEMRKTCLLKMGILVARAVIVR
jgi:hypothetical protein